MDSQATYSVPQVVCKIIKDIFAVNQNYGIKKCQSDRQTDILNVFNQENNLLRRNFLSRLSRLLLR